MKKILRRLLSCSPLAIAFMLAIGLAAPTSGIVGSLPNQVLATEAALSANTIYEQAVESVVTIYTLDKNYALAKDFGSGFIVRSDGLIVTNAHVVRASIASVLVVFSDGSSSMAKIVGYDRQGRDLAAVQLVGDHDVPVLPIAAEAMPKIGELAYTIGSPRGIANTMTSGIVGNIVANQTEILHNAAINGGNSGSPLLNDRGRVIGMNSWIAQAAVETVNGEVIGGVNGYSGMGFAIAISQITDFIADVESGVASLPAAIAQNQ